MSYLLEKLKFWRKYAKQANTPVNEDRVNQVVDIIFDMAKLLHIDPQEIMLVMKQKLEVNDTNVVIDPDIEAIVKNDMLGVGLRVR